MATGLSRSVRPRRRSLTLALVVAGLALTGCTSDGPGPGPTPGPELSVTASAGGATGPVRTPVDRPGTAAVGGASGPVAATPDPEMTVIQDAAVCTTHRQAADASYFVPPQEVFKGGDTVEWLGARLVLAGPDAANLALCPGELPPQPYCEVAPPWTGMSDDSFATAGRLQRAVYSGVQASPPQAEGAAPADVLKGARLVSYGIFDVEPGDPRGVADYLDRAVRTCAKGRQTSVAGTSALVGTTRSGIDAPSAQVVLLHRGARLLWVVLDGDGWRAGQREHALVAVVRHLL